MLEAEMLCSSRHLKHQRRRCLFYRGKMHVLHTDRHRNMSGPGNSEPCFNHSSLLCDARSSSSSFVCVCARARWSSSKQYGRRPRYPISLDGRIPTTMTQLATGRFPLDRHVRTAHGRARGEDEELAGARRQGHRPQQCR
jgi:hypothetical protein